MKSPLRSAALMLALLAGLAVAGNGRAADVQLTEKGWSLDAGAAGSFCLEYPALLDAKREATKPSKVSVRGNTATIEYPQGTKLAIAREGGSMRLHFTALTPDAKAFNMTMTLPSTLKDGGKWQLKGDDAKPVPTQFGGEQFVFNGNPKPVTIIAPQGAALSLSLPYGWQQLQDGRKWNSSTFDYMFATDMPRGTGNEAYFSFKIWSGTLDKEPAEPKAAPKPAPVARVHKTSLRLTAEGLTIEAGSGGSFTLHYPVFVGAKWDDVRKPIEKKVDGHNATLKFDGGAQIDVAFQPSDNTLTFTPTGVPGDVRSLRANMMIDFSYATGGTWKIGDRAATPFPEQKPKQPHIYQGNAETLMLRNFEGASLSVSVPPHSYQELTDNREWGWKIFAWHFDAPCTTGAGPIRVKFSLAAPKGDTPKLVDRFGQTTRQDYPGKVKREDELKQDVQTEAAWLASLQPPARDTFGGLPGSREKYGLKRTGFFHVEQKDARWILVDPEGNAFFHLGVCALQPADDYTYFAGREQLYEWLPERGGQFESAFHGNSYWKPNVVSFHLVNMIRKFGQPYDLARYTARMIERLRKWGFNSGGAFGSGDAAVRRQTQFPAVAHLPLSTWDGFADVPGVHGIFDPFSDKIRQQCEKQFAEKLPAAADDPLLIGYFLANEPLWEQIPGGVAALDGTHPCKRRLAKMLEDQYQTIEAFNRAWETSLPSFAEVAARGLPVKSAAAKADMQQYTGIFLDAYFRLITETFRRYDKHHMLIGNRFQPQTINNETACRLSGKYMDIVSFNYYCYGFDDKLLTRVHEWTGGRPMFFSEFYFNSPSDSGLSGGGKDVASQRDRGLAYRHYVEHAAALGYVVGIEWFTLVDQSVTGRWFERYNGEAANTGLIAVSDRPWRAMLDEMIKTNYGIYDVFFGARPPQVYDDPRFTAAKK